MFEIVAQMGIIVFIGILWRIYRPGGLAPDILRKALTDFVYFLLLPALVLNSLWKADLGFDSLYLIVLAVIMVFTGLALGYLSCRWCKLPAAATGAAFLAAAFPNVTYLGLPVLDATLGSWARSIAIQLDMFVCTPLLFTVGIFIAQKYGAEQGKGMSVTNLFRIPAVLAAIIAVILNVAQIPMPNISSGLLTTLASGVVPLMLFSLGLSLNWSRDQWSKLPAVIPIALIQLVLTPVVVFSIAQYLPLNDQVLTAVVIEAAMPSMVLGLVICDRFKLDTQLYAAAVTVSTTLSLFTLPLWFSFLS